MKGRILQNLFFFDFGSCYSNYSWCQLQPGRPPNPLIDIEAVVDFIAVLQSKVAIKKIPTDFLLVAFAVILVYSTKVIVCFFSVCYLDITLHPFMLFSFLFKSATLKLYMEVRFPAVLETVFHQKCKSMQVVQSHWWDYSLGSYRANLFWPTGWFAWKKCHRDPVVIPVLRFVTENGAGCWILYLLFLTVLNSQVSCCYFMWCVV